MRFLQRLRKTTIPRPEDAVKRARALFEQGQLDAANKICSAHLDSAPNHVGALLLSAEIAAAQHDSERGINALTALVRVRSDDPHVYYRRGNFRKNTGQFEAALEDYERAIALDSGHANAHCNRGVVLECLNRPTEARASYDSAIALNPRDALAHFNRAGIFRMLLQPDNALADYSRALDLKPIFPEAECNRGLLLNELRRMDEALQGYRECIKHSPAFHPAYFHYGALLQRLGRWQAALESYETAIRIHPNNAEAFCNRGVVLTELGRWDDAIGSYDQAISLKPDFAEAIGNRAEAYLHLGRHQEAIADYDSAFILDSELRFIEGARLHTRMHLCDWRDFDADRSSLESRIDAGLRAAHPWHVVGLFDSPLLQAKAAATWIREMFPADSLLGPIPRRARRDRLRIGYFSPDFRDHAVAHLIADMFDLHDRTRFEIIGFSVGPATDDAYRKRIESSMDQFIDARLDSNAEIASRARALEIDIAVDLGGHTSLSKTGVFALRAAPIQVNYLGYPGTMGANYFDYVLADETVIPRGQERHFAEKVIYLPHSYQANSQRKKTDRAFSRAELGLPADGFVFCCFNNNFKILPATFIRWMQILRQVPGSVLWLLQSNETVVANLRREAAARDVEPERLIFAQRVPPADHLARHGAADLFLDTLPYNAHTTASDALLSGLPLITCSGESFTSRVAAGLLKAVELSELIAASPQHYVRLAVELATSPGRLSGIREKLATNLPITPLFDIPAFTRQVETTYTEIYERHFQGFPAASLLTAALKKNGSSS